MRWLQWALDNLWTLLIIAGVVAQLLQAMKGRKGQGDAAPEAHAAPQDYEFEDPELAERTRRIREEIQRKIAQRQRGDASDAESTPEPASWDAEPAAFEEAPPVIRPTSVERAPAAAPAIPGYATRLDAQRSAEILEQQAALAERLRQAQDMKAAAQRRAAFEAQSISPVTQARQVARGALLDDLHSPAALRRAFVLREVLGPPVGLR